MLEVQPKYLLLNAGKFSVFNFSYLVINKIFWSLLTLKYLGEIDNIGELDDFGYKKD